MATSTITQTVLKADWQLLRRQKATLVKLGSKLQDAGDRDHEHVDGIIHFLDAAIDAAAEVVGAEVVFGRQR